jgi:LysR family transcriptional regulator (chromosome initiation inhibitor)
VFVARWFPDGVTAPALLAAPTLTFSDQDQLQARWADRHFKRRRQALPTHRMASSQAFVDACLAGLGWGVNPEPLVAPHLASGALVELLPDTALDVELYWQFTRLAGPVLAPVTAAIRQKAGSTLVPPA